MRDCTKCSLPTMLYPNYSGETNGTTVGVYTLIHICVCWLIRLGTSIILRLDYGIYDGVSHRTYNFCTCFAVHVFAKHSSDELSFCTPTAGFQVDGASTAATTVELVIYVIWRKYLHGGFLSHRSIPKIIQDFPWKQPSFGLPPWLKLPFCTGHPSDGEDAPAFFLGGTFVLQLGKNVQGSAPVRNR